MLIFRGVGGGNSNMFYFQPDPWGFMIQFEEHIFQMGRFNHQLDKLQEEHFSGIIFLRSLFGIPI